MRYLNSVTVPKNVKGESLWIFLTSIVLQSIETKEGETFWCNANISKKSHNAEKDPSEKQQKRDPQYVFHVLDVDVVGLDVRF